MTTTLRNDGNDHEHDDEEQELQDRRQAELDFVRSAYAPNEAWITTNNSDQDDDHNNNDANDDDNITTNDNDNSKRRNTVATVHRRLPLKLLASSATTITTTYIVNDNDDGHDGGNWDERVHSGVVIHLALHMSPGYPLHDAVQVFGTVQMADNDALVTAGSASATNNTDNNHKHVKTTTTTTTISKAAYNALPHLLSTCRQVADENQGQEAVFLVLQQADEWIESEWPNFVLVETIPNSMHHPVVATDDGNAHDGENATTTTPRRRMVLGRRLIYSHHIIAKRKRADLQSLAREYDLTGYVKIGWPGIIVIEGLEEHCQQFYDDIRQWSWQYLVVRGEMQEEAAEAAAAIGQPPVNDWNALRRFTDFVETDDMSVVAQACRNADLEDLFQTSMKVYRNNHDNNHPSTTTTTGPDSQASSSSSSSQSTPYGALIRVDHMNAAKAYRKWLRKTSHELDLVLLIKEYHAQQPQQPPQRPTMIIVGAVGDDESSVTAFLKRWRTQKVDLDSKGRPCLERMLSILAQGRLEKNPSKRVDWEDEANQDNHLIVSTKESLIEWIGWMGGKSWEEAIREALTV